MKNLFVHSFFSKLHVFWSQFLINFALILIGFKLASSLAMKIVMHILLIASSLVNKRHWIIFSHWIALLSNKLPLLTSLGRKRPYPWCFIIASLHMLFSFISSSLTWMVRRIRGTIRPISNLITILIEEIMKKMMKKTFDWGALG